MNLKIEQLEQIEAPMSNDYWTGVGIGAAVLAVVGAGIAIAIAT